MINLFKSRVSNSNRLIISKYRTSGHNLVNFYHKSGNILCKNIENKIFHEKFNETTHIERKKNG